MRCASCGHENEADRKFCGQCGARLSVLCPTCGHGNPPEDRFCGECGTSLSTDAGVAAIADPTPSSAETETTLEARASDAERRLVTVLFADLVGFTSMAEDRDPERVREYLTGYFEAARETIGRYGGTIEKFIGDAVMAVWGTPVANEDDAERAVRAALDLVDAVPALDIDGIAGLQARAGVMTGEAAVNLAARGESMVAGDLVNSAARLQSEAAPGTVLVGDATYHSARQGIAFEPAGDRRVKGKEAPISAWQALRVIAGVRGTGRTASIEPPFVGRDDELALLRDLYHATVRERRARLVSVVGVAGIGKSRLAWEVFKYLDGIAELLYWHEGRSPAYGEGVTFWALGEMVRRRAGLAETDDETATRDKIAATLAEFVPEIEERRWIEPRLLALLGLEDAPPGEREELFAAWRTFFERIADQAPVVMVFEDLHWADAGLIEFIESILEWSRGRSILIITLARPELLDRRPTWGAGRHHFTALHLEPLASESMTELVSGMVPGLPEAAVQPIVAQAEGIPLYAVETFRMLVDDGRLEAIDGGFRVTGSLDRLDIPPTLHALIAARLDALAPEDRVLLQSASVLGTTFTIAGITAMTDLAAGDVEQHLRTIARRELIELDLNPRSPERGQYGFVQSLIREVAYGTLGRRERRARHLTAARFYETLGDDELAAILASHYVAAYEASPDGPEADAVAAQARVTLRGAAERAMALHSYDHAQVLYRQALTVTPEPAERAAILERLADAAYFGGHFDAGKAALGEAIAWYDANARAGDAVRTRTRLGAIQLHEGMVPAGLATLEAAAARIDAGEEVDDEVYAGLATELARAHWRNAEPPENVLPWAEKALIVGERLGLARVIAEALDTKAGALADTGRLQEALALMRGAVHHAEAHGLIEAELRARNNLLFIDLDNPIESLAVAKEGLATARRIGLRDWVRQLTAVTLGVALFSVGDWDWCLDQAEVFADDEVPLNYRLMFGHVRSVTDGYRGDLAGARRQLDETRAQLTPEVDPQTHIADTMNGALLDALSGDAAGALRTMTALLPTTTGTWAMNAYMQAGTFALLARDEAAMRVIRDGWRSVGVRGRVADTYPTIFDAAIEAFEGRTASAAAGFRAASQTLDELGFRVDRAFLLIGAVGILPGEDPYRRVAIDEARALADELGSPTLLALLETAIGSARKLSPAGAERARTAAAKLAGPT